MGLGTVVIRSHSQPGVDLTYIKQTGESNGEAGDQYVGLDRFGRVVDQRWIKTSDGSVTDRFKYGYDRDSNRLYRDNSLNNSFDELYHANGASNGYDGLNQLTDFRRGALSDSNSDGVLDTVTTASRTQSWDFDALGNFDAQNTNGTNQTRSHNEQNEITSISGATTPTYDANGNMTGDETGRKFVYDAWNRLVTVKDSGNNVLESLAYDGVNRRVSTTASSTTTDLYYSAEWQVLEERVGGNTTMQFVWSPVYIDAMILRDRDTDSNGSLDERFWVQQDANWNMTAVVNGSGSVVERYAYDPFGSAAVYDASWGSRSSSSYSWVYLHQGGRYDSTAGLYYFRNRDYSPTLGRWMSEDPIRFEAADTNLYRYVMDNPVCHADSLGLQGPSAPPVPTTGGIRPVPRPGGGGGGGGPVVIIVAQVASAIADAVEAKLALEEATQIGQQLDQDIENRKRNCTQRTGWWPCKEGAPSDMRLVAMQYLREKCDNADKLLSIGNCEPIEMGPPRKGNCPGQTVWHCRVYYGKRVPLKDTRADVSVIMCPCCTKLDTEWKWVEGAHWSRDTEQYKRWPPGCRPHHR